MTNFGKIERGTANPSFLTMLRIAGVLGADIAHLVEGISAHHLPEDIVVISATEFIRSRAHSIA